MTNLISIHIADSDWNEIQSNDNQVIKNNTEILKIKRIFVFYIFSIYLENIY